MSERCGGFFHFKGAGQEPHPFSLPGATEHYAADRPARAEHLRLEVSLDFDRREVRGTCTTRLRAVRELRWLTFDAVELEVEQVSVNGAAAEFTNSGRHVRVTLPRPLGADQTAEVAIRYRCHPARGLYFWGPDEGYPDRPVQAWTQGQDEDARYWFPCLDAPAQKATSELSATFPAGFTAVSNGVLVADEVKGELRTMRYRLDVPHSPYLVTLVVGELEELTAKAGATSLRYLFPPGRREDALRCVERTPQMIQLFEELTGEPFPFPVYSQVFVTEFIFGGMENTSATTLTDVVLHDLRAHQDYSAEPLVSHELAHQWFGDLLTCREWPHGWLNEGFATYFEVLWKERADSRDEADQQRRTDLDLYLQEVAQRYARPIVARKFDAPIDLFDRHLYEKGALVLHELRRRLGDALFFRAIRHYVSRHRTRSVETVDLARAIEEATGHNLDRFFDQYVFSPGHPVLKVEVHYEPEQARLRLKVNQKQKTGEGGWPVFHLPLEVEVVAGDETTRHTVELTDLEHTFYLRSAKEPTRVSVDPRREVLGTLEVDKPLGYWISELQSAEHARTRTEAALALGKNASTRAVEALASALRKDSFWASQAACAKALGMARTPRAKRALLENVRLAHPKARRAVLAALGEFRRDEEVAQALRSVCERGDESYFVEGEAGRALGKLRVEGALPVLERMTTRPSFQDAIAVGAIDGMAESLDPQAYGLVEPRVRYGQPPFVRRASAVALAKLAEPADKKREAVEILSELFRDRQFRVQMAALESAQELGDRRLIGPLESTPFLDGRARRAAREAVRALREGTPKEKELASLREELDRLKEETRGLKEQVEALTARPEKPVKRAPPKKRRTKKR